MLQWYMIKIVHRPAWKGGHLMWDVLNRWEGIVLIREASFDQVLKIMSWKILHNCMCHLMHIMNMAGPCQQDSM